MSMQVCVRVCICMSACARCAHMCLNYICVLDDILSVCVCFISISATEPVDYFLWSLVWLLC